MRRSLRSTRRRVAVLAIAGLAVLATVVTAGAAPAANTSVSALTAAHKCLVMTGSGDPAFVKNFNPYTATGLPSGAFVQGAFYEPLIVTGEGGLKPVPWLARSWAWSNGNKTLTLNIAKGVKWSDGTPLTAKDVVYSLTAGQQNAVMDRIGLTGAGNNIASIRAKGSTGHDHAEDAGLAVHLVDPQQAVRRAAAHLVEGGGPDDVHEPEPGGLGTVRRHQPLHDAGLRVRQEPELLAARAAEGPVPRVRAGRLERQRPRADPERPGRLDAQLRAERRECVRGEGPGSTSTRSTRRPRIRSRSCSTRRSIRTAWSRSARR